MQPTKESTSDDATIPSKDAFSLLQPQASNSRQDQEHKLEIDNEAPGLSFLLNPRLYKVEELDQVKLHRRQSDSLNKKKPTCKK